MNDILEFHKPYLPSLEAAQHDLDCAEVAYRVAKETPYDFGPNYRLERIRHTRERVFKAQDYRREAASRESQKRTGIWA